MMHRKFLALLALLLCLALSVPALAAEGLAAFQNPQNAAARCVFRCSVRQLVCSRRARPFPAAGHERHGEDELLPRSRPSPGHRPLPLPCASHAACNDGEIAETGGAWYEPYIAYATEAKLLPSTCPDGSAVTAKTITRAGAGGPVCECAARRGSCPRSTTRPSRI